MFIPGVWLHHCQLHLDTPSCYHHYLVLQNWKDGNFRTTSPGAEDGVEALKLFGPGGQEAMLCSQE